MRFNEDMCKVSLEGRVFKLELGSNVKVSRVRYSAIGSVISFPSLAGSCEHAHRRGWG